MYSFSVSVDKQSWHSLPLCTVLWSINLLQIWKLTAPCSNRDLSFLVSSRTEFLVVMVPVWWRLLSFLEALSSFSLWGRLYNRTVCFLLIQQHFSLTSLYPGSYSCLLRYMRCSHKSDSSNIIFSIAIPDGENQTIYYLDDSLMLRCRGHTGIIYCSNLSLYSFLNLPITAVIRD